MHGKETSNVSRCLIALQIKDKHTLIETSFLVYEGGRIIMCYKRRKIMDKEPRIDKSVIQIKLAFLGATRNLCLLENKFMNMKNIPIYQYTNYLSQLALCIELGLKGIIINSNEFECIHDLGKLFFSTPDVFQQKIKSVYSEETFNSNISIMKKIVVDFRYMELCSTLKEYFDESMMNNDQTINLKEATNQVNLKFLRLLLEEIQEYEKQVINKGVYNGRN